MCGIAGFISKSNFGYSGAKKQVVEMGEALNHRGPDHTGYFFDENIGLAMVHKRLSILDPSDAGNQPMCSPSGRFVISFNGEIYNHLELRSELAMRNVQIEWRGRSDTETILACVDAFGFPEALQKLSGMFAIALYDKKTRKLFLARDRIGEKPIYYGWQGGSSFFASELKAIKLFKAFIPKLNREALARFLNYSYVPTPLTIYSDVFKLEPGHYVELDNGCEPKCFWDPFIFATEKLPHDELKSDNDLLADLETLLRRSVQNQMQSDVPFGAFLSGGIDSSLITSLMQQSSIKKIDTYSIGFEDQDFDEAPFAKSVARHIGTNHHEYYVSAEDALELVPSLPQIYDEPFSDSSQLPMILLARMTRQNVSVALSGDGGDELFGGYSRHVFADKIWRLLRLFPRQGRNSAVGLLNRISTEKVAAVLSSLLAIAPKRYRHRNIGDKINKIKTLLGSSSEADMYVRLTRHWRSVEDILDVSSQHHQLRQIPQQFEKNLSSSEKMMLLDLLRYLPDDLLVKLDRAAMSTSLETRLPYLDQQVVEFALKMPAHLKIRGVTGKWCLREILYKSVPRALVDRPKVGFGVPLASWLRGPLREHCEVFCSRGNLEDAGYFNPKVIEKKWKQHVSREENWHHEIWNIFVFEIWRRHNGL